MKRKGLLLGLGLMLLFVTGCGTTSSSGSGNKDNNNNSSTNTKEEEKKVEEKKTRTITSKNGHFSLEVNDTWVELEQGKLNKAAALEIGAQENSSQIKYGMILPDDAVNFTSYDTWYNTVIESASKNYNFDVNEVKDVTINGYEAKYITYNTSVSGYVFYMRAYFVKGTTYYSQMYFWTIAADKDKLDSEFIEMANSYKEM